MIYLKFETSIIDDILLLVILITFMLLPKPKTSRKVQKNGISKQIWTPILLTEIRNRKISNSGGKILFFLTLPQS